MLRISETIKVGDWIITLIANKCILGGDWEISARDICTQTERHPDWYCGARHPSGVKALKAGHEWAQKTFK